MLPRGQAVPAETTRQPKSGPFNNGGLNNIDLVVTASGSTVAVSNTVGISAAALPLPTGAATQTTLALVDTHVQATTTALGSPFQVGGSIGNTSFGITGSVAVTNVGTFAVQNTAAIVVPTVIMTHTTVTTGVASALALASNGSAKYRLFQNVDATNSITISLSVAAIASTQITLFPKERYEMSLVLGNMDTRQVNCIAVAGTPNLLVTEGV